LSGSSTTALRAERRLASVIDPCSLRVLCKLPKARPRTPRAAYAKVSRVLFAPVIDFRALMAIDPRVTRHTFDDVWMIKV
jgi:hypothetical protein